MEAYFRIVLKVPSGPMIDQVVYVERKTEDEVLAYIKGRTDIKSWERISKEQLPHEMKFKPYQIIPTTWESTTGFTPLGPRPTDPRDPTATRNP